jgi:hypothetical protein
MSKTIDQLIDELNSTDTKVETINFDTPIKQERRRQLDKKLDKIFRPKLTEEQEMDIAERQLIDLKENKR